MCRCKACWAFCNGMEFGLETDASGGGGGGGGGMGGDVFKLECDVAERFAL